MRNVSVRDARLDIDFAREGTQSCAEDYGNFRLER
jgi:hypothetical protein